MSQLLQPYQMGLVYGDVSNEEVLQDIVYSLSRLANTVDDIFGRVQAKIDDEKARIGRINARVEACERKVAAIRGVTKATTVFSTAKYPAPKILPTQSALFNQPAQLPSAHREATDEAIYLLADPKRSIIGNNELANEVNAILMRINTYGSDMERVEFIMEEKGLGSLPNFVPSIGSMLLFNSSINPYKEYQTLDNLMSTGRDKAMEDEEKKALASAPTTMLSGDALPDILTMDLSYRPEMGQMSGLALPANLPLDFLAADVQFSGVALPSIAPSSHLRPNLALPQITDGGLTFAQGPSAKQPPPVPSSAGGPPPPPPPPAAGGPPPPPPGATAGMPPAAPPAAGGPPAPPAAPSVPASGPPAPPQASVPVSGPPSAGPPPADMAPPDASDEVVGGRAGLLDAIRGMNVNKLKKRSVDDSEGAKKAPRKEEKARPLSMQDDLKARLMRRNNAMSGKSDKDSQRRDSLVIQQARRDSTSLPQTSNPNPSPSTNTSATNAKSVKFSSNNDSDSDTPRMPTKKPAKDDDSDSDSGSDVSIDEVVAPRAPVPSVSSRSPLAPPVPTPVPSTSQPQVQPQTAPAPTQSGGGLMDSHSVVGLLSKAKAKADQDGSDDDDWD